MESLSFLQSLQHDLCHQRMQAQVGAKHEVDLWKLSRQSHSLSFQVIDDMDPRRQEIGEHQHLRGPLLRTLAAPIGDGRLSKFQVRDFDNLIFTSFRDQSGKLDQVIIGSRTTTTMGNQEDGDLRIRTGHLLFLIWLRDSLRAHIT
jgi:hypothetical protein